MSTPPRLTVSRRLRSTPFTSRVMARGASAFTVYNRMLLPTVFESMEADYRHLVSAVQVWDVGVERQVQIEGPDATKLVQWMTPRDIGRAETGRCYYLPLVDARGRLVNDPVGLKLEEDRWWLSIADSDVELWADGLATGAGLDVEVSEPAVWPLAVQGPKAEELVARVFGEAVRGIRFFRFERLDSFEGHPLIVARSGWSKQGGFEVYVDDGEVGGRLHDALFEAGADLDVRAGCPNGIERIEGSLLSFGNDMDDRDSPIEAGLSRVLDLDADIDSLSLAALRTERDRGPAKRLAGVVVESAEGESEGSGDAPLEPFGLEGWPGSEVRSQTFSPRAGTRIGIAMLESGLEDGARVPARGTDGTVAEVRVTPLPFAL